MDYEGDCPGPDVHNQARFGYQGNRLGGTRTLQPQLAVSLVNSLMSKHLSLPSIPHEKTLFDVEFILCCRAEVELVDGSRATDNLLV